MIMGCHHPVAAGDRRPWTSRNSQRGAGIHARTESKSDETDSGAGLEARNKVFNCQNLAQKLSRNRARIVAYAQHTPNRTVGKRVVNAESSVHDQCVSETPTGAAL